MCYFDGAQSALRTAYRLSEEAHDVHAQTNATALIARIPLAQGLPQKTLDILEDTHSEEEAQGWRVSFGRYVRSR